MMCALASHVSYPGLEFEEHTQLARVVRSALAIQTPAVDLGGNLTSEGGEEDGGRHGAHHLDSGTRRDTRLESEVRRKKKPMTFKFTFYSPLLIDMYPV